jgi:hypothetical protein
MLPEFIVTAYTGEDQTGEATGTTVEVDTPLGAVVFETGVDDCTHVRFPGINLKLGDHEVILEG